MSPSRMLRILIKLAIPIGYAGFIAFALLGSPTNAQIGPTILPTLTIVPTIPGLTPTATETATVTATATVTPTATLTVTPTATPTPVASTLTLKPGTLIFPFLLVLPPNGVASSPKNAVLSVSRKAPAPVTIESITPSDPTQFSVGANSCQSIAPGTSCNVPITFTPRNLRAQKAVLMVTSNAQNGVVSIQLIGHGKQGKLTVAPRSLNFGVVDVTVTSPSKTVTLTNSNPVQMNLSGITTSNQAVFPFQIEQNTCGATLAPNASCSLQIVFKPPQNGPFKGTFFVNDNAMGSPQTIRLAGSGRNGPVATRTATPTATPTAGPTPASGTFPMRSVPTIH